MFTVNFYTISKKRNSTALPSGSATAFNCIAKEPMSIHNPSLTIRFAAGAAANPVTFNYCYISDFSRYYWITDWVNDGPNWTCSCVVDVLASFRTDIRNYTTYVLRSASSYDGDIIDTMYPATTEKTQQLITLTSPWEGIPEPIVDNTLKGFYSVGVATAGCIKYYMLNSYWLEYLLSYIVSYAYAQEAIDDLQLLLYPETRIALNPLQYITSIIYIPMSGPYNAGTTVNSIKIGTVDVQVTAKEYATESARTILAVQRSLTNNRHPLADTRGRYLNIAPWSTYELFYPPFGLIPLDSSVVGRAIELSLMIVVDCRTGDGVLNVYATVPRGNVNVTTQIAQVSAKVGIEMPISGLLQRQSGGMSAISEGLSGFIGLAVSAETGNAAGALTSLASITDSFVGDAARAAIPHLSIIGGQGSCASLTGIPQIQIHNIMPINDNPTEYGKPLCSSVQLSTLSGFTLCSGADLSINGTADEQEELNAFLNGGFYLA